KQRKTIHPVFGHARIAAQAPAVAQEGAHLVERLKGHVGGGPVDVMHELTGLTLGVLGRTLLDTDLGEFSGIGHAFEAVQDQAMFEMVSLSKVPMWVPLPKQVRFRRARAELRDVVATLVRQRQEHWDPDADDVVTRLIISTRQESDPKVADRR